MWSLSLFLSAAQLSGVNGCDLKARCPLVRSETLHFKASGCSHAALQFGDQALDFSDLICSTPGHVYFACVNRIKTRNILDTHTH